MRERVRSVVGSLRLVGPDVERLLDAIEQPAALCTLDTRPLAGNTAFEQACGSLDALEADAPLVNEEAARDALAAGRIWQGVSVAADGNVTLVPLKTSDGAVGACIALLPDRDSALERERLKSQLEQLRRTDSLGRLAGGIAHDFNNMLAVILNYVDLADRRTGPGAPASDAIRHIRDAAERSSELTQQLLALNRRPPGEAPLVDVNHAVASLEPVLVSTLGEGIEYRTELAEGLWPVRLSRPQLQRILLNLAANSRDAMSGSGSFSVRTANVEVDSLMAARHEDFLPGRYVELEAADSGPGMPEEVAAHIFEPFFTTKEVGVGTGLGLSIIYGIVKQAGGHVSVWSRSGSGTRFSIYMAAHDDSSLPPPKKSERRRVILVVDDERPLRRAVARMLADSGYTVIQAADGSEALEVLAQRGAVVGMVLTDVLMPRMSGVEFARQLAVQYPSVEVVFMSGYAHDLISSSGIDPARMLYLQKPFTKQELLDALEQAWQRVVEAGK